MNRREPPLAIAVVLLSIGMFWMALHSSTPGLDHLIYVAPRQHEWGFDDYQIIQSADKAGDFTPIRIPVRNVFERSHVSGYYTGLLHALAPGGRMNVELATREHVREDGSQHGGHAYDKRRRVAAQGFRSGYQLFERQSRAVARNRGDWAAFVEHRRHCFVSPVYPPLLFDEAVENR